MTTQMPLIDANSKKTYLNDHEAVDITDLYTRKLAHSYVLQ